jgi:transcriptional regulator with XRE-family HTH domain
MSEQPATPPGVPEWDTADRLRKALRHADLGVQEMASYLDVSRNTVGNWINGRIEPSTQTLRLWALRCGVSYEWLTEGRNPAVLAGQRDVNKLGYGRHRRPVRHLRLLTTRSAA